MSGVVVAIVAVVPIMVWVGIGLIFLVINKMTEERMGVLTEEEVSK